MDTILTEFTKEELETLIIALDEKIDELPAVDFAGRYDYGVLRAKINIILQAYNIG